MAPLKHLFEEDEGLSELDLEKLAFAEVRGKGKRENGAFLIFDVGWAVENGKARHMILCW